MLLLQETTLRPAADIAGALRGFALAMALASSNPASRSTKGPCRDRLKHSAFRPL
jgi:hypothetical protein